MTDLEEALRNTQEAERVATAAYRTVDQAMMDLRIAQIGMIEASKALRAAVAGRVVEEVGPALETIAAAAGPPTHESRLAEITPRPGTYTRSDEGVLQIIEALGGEATVNEAERLSGWSYQVTRMKFRGAEDRGAIAKYGRRKRETAGREPIVYVPNDGARPVRDDPDTAEPVVTGAESSVERQDRSAGATVEVPQDHAGVPGSAPSAPEPPSIAGDGLPYAAATTDPADDLDVAEKMLASDPVDQYDGRTKRELLAMCEARGIAATKTDSIFTLKTWLRGEVSEDPGFNPGHTTTPKAKQSRESDEVRRARVLENEIEQCLAGERAGMTTRGIGKCIVRNVHEVAATAERMRARGDLVKDGEFWTLANAA